MTDQEPQNRKVLVLDDEEDLTFLLRSVLEFNHFNVTVANDPLKALKLLEQEAYDLFITDYRMDGLNGMEVIGRLRNFPIAEKMKIIMLTFMDLADDEVKSLSKYNALYLRKPFLPNELIQKIWDIFT